MKCPNCGSELDMEQGCCDYCGSSFTPEMLSQISKGIKGAYELTKGDLEKERLLKNAETFLKLNEKQKAAEIYNQLTEEYPEDYRGWFGSAKIVFERAKTAVESLSCEDIQNDLFQKCSAKNSILFELIALNDIEEKIRILNPEFHSAVSDLESQIMRAYKEKGFPPINPISIELLNHVDDVRRCSPEIQAWGKELEVAIIVSYENKMLPALNPISESVFNNYEQVSAWPERMQIWAEGLIKKYIEEYEKGEITQLLWHCREFDLEHKKRTYAIYKSADVNAFCLRGQELAKKVNKLPYVVRKQLLCAWGVNNINNRLSPHDYLYFVLGRNVCFYSGYGEYASVASINRCITEANIQAELEDWISIDVSVICEHCGGSIDPIGFCTECGSCNQEKEAQLCEKLQSVLNNSIGKYSLFMELRDAFDSTSFHPREPWKNPNFRRSYSFTRVSMREIELGYEDVEKGINIMGLYRRNGTVGSINYPRERFVEIYRYMLRRKCKCPHCGSSFGAWFRKVCRSCGKVTE